MCLKRLNYDRKELERRREESMHLNKGNLFFFIIRLQSLAYAIVFYDICCFQQQQQPTTYYQACLYMYPLSVDQDKVR